MKRLGLSFTLILVLAVAAFAGETQSPPCNPGETQSPPCSSQSVSDDPTDPGQTSTPPTSDMVDLIDIGDVVLWALSLF